MNIRLMLVAAMTLVLAVIVALTCLVKVILCAACTAPQALVTLSMLGLGSTVVAVGAAVVLIWTLRAEAAKQAGRPSSNSKSYRLLAGFFGLAAFGYLVLGAEPNTRTIIGKPVEVRAWSRNVVMPGDGGFHYVCWKDEGRGSGTCPAEARWAALPRWPQPQEVRMVVEGHRIRSLTMDGQVIVEASEFEAGDRQMVLLAWILAVGALAYAGAPLIGSAYERVSQTRRPGRPRRPAAVGR